MEEIEKILKDFDTERALMPEDTTFDESKAIFKKAEDKIKALIIRVTDELLKFQSPAEEHHERHELRNELLIKRDILLGK